MKAEFYTYNRRADRHVGFEKQTGETVKNKLGLTLFIHKNPVPESGKKNKDLKPWSVTERSTGMALVTGRTKKEALEKLETVVPPMMTKIRKQIAEFHKNTGYPPGYTVDDEVGSFDVVAGSTYEEGTFLASFEDYGDAINFAEEALSAHPVVSVYDIMSDDIRYLDSRFAGANQ